MSSYRLRSIPACAGEPASPLSRTGSIPACAGEPRTNFVAFRVYPRVCGGTTGCAGETSSIITREVYPRVCGGTRRPTRLSPTGSIPACAGEPLVNVIEHALLYSYLEYY